jgi:hypothetical protein
MATSLLAFIVFISLAVTFKAYGELDNKNKKEKGE